MPDVAAIGENYLIFVSGESFIVGGTSLSAPVFAAMLTRINEARLNAGKGTIGYVNPVLVSRLGISHLNSSLRVFEAVC